MSNKDDLTTVRWHAVNSTNKLPWSLTTNAGLMAHLNEVLGYAPPAYRPIPIGPLPDASSPQRIALCLGHARSTDEGNVGAGGISEEFYNTEIIERVAALLRLAGVDVITVTYYEGSGYTAAMEWLARKLNDEKVTAAVEFHFNASEKKSARGHEMLHWKSSVRGVTLAAEVLASLNQEFPAEPNRGLKPKIHTDRGALFLSLTHCPAAIAEPFFGDNLADWKLFSSEVGKERLASAYVVGIINWIQKQPTTAAA